MFQSRETVLTPQNIENETLVCLIANNDGLGLASHGSEINKPGSGENLSGQFSAFIIGMFTPLTLSFTSTCYFECLGLGINETFLFLFFFFFQ